MKDKQQAVINRIKVIGIMVFMILLIFLVTNSTKILKNPTDIFIVANGSLSYEEPTEGYVIREETVLQGENHKNGMVPIVSDNQRAAKGEAIFRYYSNGEEAIVKQIEHLDEEINIALENSGALLPTSDIVSLEKQIENVVNSMYDLNDMEKIQEHKKEIDAYISKKTKIKGALSPSDSYVKTLTSQREALEAELEEGSEIIYAPISGMVSYRVDGLEEVLGIENFDYLSSDLLKGFNLKVGSTIPPNEEKGKLVNNFHCYIATIMNSERASVANVGDTVTIRLSTANEVDTNIVYIKEEDDGNRIIVFEIEKDVADLIAYRKISFDIIWWKYSGWKISNAAIIEEDDKTYVERNKAGYAEKILVKVLRQNDTFSIVNNYTDEELLEMGYTEEEIAERNSLKLYDEIILH